MPKWNYFLGIFEIITKNKKRYFFNLLKVKMYSQFATKGINVKVLSPQETIDYVIKSKKSLIRWGDGETRIMFGGNIFYQKFTPELKKSFTKILSEYNNNSSYVLAIPPKINLHGKELKKTGEAKYWESSKYFFKKRINEKSTYGDATVFYSNTLTKEYASRLWRNEKNIVLVHHDIDVFLKFKKDYPSLNVQFVKIPETNSFDSLNSILNDVLHVLKNNKMDINKTKVLVCAGPAAKSLVYELSKKGIISYDIGSYFNLKSFDHLLGK